MSQSKFGLSPETQKKINEVFALHSEVASVKIYGSRAKGNFKPCSDIDLTLYGNGLKTEKLLKIENQLDDLLLPYKIDLSIFEHIENTDLTDHIQRVGLDFYSK